MWLFVWFKGFYWWNKKKKKAAWKSWECGPSFNCESQFSISLGKKYEKCVFFCSKNRISKIRQTNQKKIQTWISVVLLSTALKVVLYLVDPPHQVVPVSHHRIRTTLNNLRQRSDSSHLLQHIFCHLHYQIINNNNQLHHSCIPLQIFSSLFSLINQSLDLFQENKPHNNSKWWWWWWKNSRCNLYSSSNNNLNNLDNRRPQQQRLILGIHLPFIMKV